jgi:cytidine deaminase
MESSSQGPSPEVVRQNATAISNADIDRLSNLAWRVRENAYVIGPTKVGCSVLCEDGSVFTGCNVEHRYRCHDVHAEVNAITNMVASGCESSIVAIFIAAERARFTPCGGCMDWIMQFARDSACLILSQSTRGGETLTLSAHEMMPYYPE